MNTSIAEKVLGIGYKNSIAEIRMKFKNIFELSDFIDEVKLRSDNFLVEEQDLYLINNCSLMLSYKANDSMILYSIFEEFDLSGHKSEQYVKLFAFSDIDYFFEESSDIRELSGVIGSIMNEVLTDSMRASMDGYSIKPYNEGLPPKSAIIKWL